MRWAIKVTPFRVKGGWGGVSDGPGTGGGSEMARVEAAEGASSPKTAPGALPLESLSALLVTTY
jgi:hypothetical protein